MAEWRRRKPLWPIMVALGLLCILAVAAPSCWKGYGYRYSKNDSTPATVLPRVSDHIASQGPSANISTDHLVDAPLPEVNKLDFPEIEPVKPLPRLSEFNFDRLLAMRDLVRMVVDQMPEPAVAPTPILVPPVRVSSEQDRLAMVPPRLRRSHSARTLQSKSLHVAEEDEAANFAEILLRASRYPQSNSKTEPRLAMRPARIHADTEVAVPVEPIVAEPALLGHRPTALIEMLEDFTVTTPGAVWSQQVLAEIRKLTSDLPPTEQHHASKAFDHLKSLHAAGVLQLKNDNSDISNNQWRIATLALGRRLELWELLLDPEQPTITGESDSLELTPAALMPILNEIASLLEEEQNGTDWREYLLLDSIADATSEGIGPEAKGRTKLAQKVLARMDDQRLTQAQQQFLTLPQMTQLRVALRPWAAGKVNLETLAALVERYESDREMRYAAAIAQLQQRLKWSDDPRLQELGAHLEQHYRGANMRFAFSDDLLNRMVPKQEPIVSPVHARIAGAKVRGLARTTTQLHVRLLPDEDAWRFGLDAFGKVYTTTRSDTWPARVRNAAKMQYQARKEISIDTQGLHVAPAKASAKGRNELLGVDSQLDPVPILGHLLRDLAKKKNNKSRPTAMNQAKSKVVRQVKQRMDSGADKKLEALEQKFRSKVLAPIEQLTLLAEPLDIHTTQKRAVMRLRLANQGQLAAHTPRPIAPSDSLLSMQMHETVINNAVMGLDLDGRRMSILQLFSFINQRFGKSQTEPPADIPRHAIIKFAARDAIQLQCDGDRLHLILSIAELAHRRDKIKNFQVHVYFRPLLNGLDVRLVRDGTLQFSGRRLKTGPRVVLHSIIGKLLPKDQEIQLLNPALTEDPRLAGLMVTQLVIEDGWIGLALGPAHARRTAWRAPRPEILGTPFVR